VSGPQRHSVAEEQGLLTDPDAIARLEAENALRQFDETLDLVDQVVRDGRPFRLRPSVILSLHRTALAGLSRYAGTYRTSSVTIGMSAHNPPGAALVSSLMEEMCDDINDQFAHTDALELCAQAMWRLNWIHPFTDGNGRTSRAVAYFVLCAKIGYRLPGTVTLPEHIARDKVPYYDALEAADTALAAGTSDVTVLRSLLQKCLVRQLESALADASNPAIESAEARRVPRHFH
jgi:Fic family protein